MTTISNKFRHDQISKSRRKWVEPWYPTYAIQGIVVAGLFPIILIGFGELDILILGKLKKIISALVLDL